MPVLTSEFHYRSQLTTCIPDGGQMQRKIVTPPDDSLAYLAERFFEHLKFNSPQSTFNTYRARTRVFLRWLNSERGVANPTLSDFNYGVLDEYLSWCMAQRPTRKHLCHKNSKIPGVVSANTVRGAMDAIKAFSRWLLAKRYVLEDATDGLPIPARDESGERPRSVDANIVAIIEQAKLNPDAKPGALDTALLYLVANSMMRVDEIVRAEVDDLNLENCSLLSQSKGRKKKKKYTYYFTPQTADAIRAWLAFRPKDCEHARLFCHGPRRVISDEYIRGIIRAYAKKAGIANADGLLPHGQKHMGACRLARAGCDLATIAERCAHSRVTTTLMHYLHADQAVVKSSHVIGVETTQPTAPFPQLPVAEPEVAPTTQTEVTPSSQEVLCRPADDPSPPISTNLDRQATAIPEANRQPTRKFRNLPKHQVPIEATVRRARAG